ncbi:rho GDP-dissociation inhibitor 1-like [Littorina saxatilis]|uniref:Rho GDP-dissociation inhibitor 3 n=1 Tax=Littorina saxatilis TaxID=31220 RepID=A0AAN9BWF6_9CAEN
MAEQDEPVQAVAAGEDDENNEDNPDYRPPAPKSLDEILKADQEDESLRKYKEQLLAGAGAGETIVIDDSNPLNVIVKKLAISVEGRDDMELDLTQSKDAIKQNKIVLKEGCKYRVKIFFYVQRDIVAGLRYEQKVYRKGVRVDKGNHMVGSYGPKREMHVYKAPEEDAPSGMLARGDYKVESRFTDDDKHIYLEWEWHLSIKKDFE